GWVSCLSRTTATAAGANLFVTYLAQFWPQAKESVPRALVLTLLIGVIAVINYRGVSAGARLSNVFTVAKLVPLFAFICTGLIFVLSRNPAAAASTRAWASTGEWLQAVLVLMFAYGGFEAGLMPMGEVQNPERDAPFALFAALATVTVIYTAIQIVVIQVLPNSAASDRPLAAAAREFLGQAGAVLIS